MKFFFLSLVNMLKIKLKLSIATAIDTKSYRCKKKNNVNFLSIETLR